jgi:hypothetical protein
MRGGKFYPEFLEYFVHIDGVTDGEIGLHSGFAPYSSWAAIWESPLNLWHSLWWEGPQRIQLGVRYFSILSAIPWDRQL